VLEPNGLHAQLRTLVKRRTQAMTHERMRAMANHVLAIFDDIRTAIEQGEKGERDGAEAGSAT
jgi:hypothetical protein